LIWCINASRAWRLPCARAYVRDTRVSYDTRVSLRSTRISSGQLVSP